ncbi:MAG: type III secretion system low calcium response chaperone LcrH/SycD [Chlamydiales bacterium]|jgi:type III secretion system low calcium response chaperone LcrH/SycD
MMDLRFVEQSQRDGCDKDISYGPDSLTENGVDALYSIAYQFYQNAHYEDAICTFSMLASIAPFDKKHWIGLGAARQVHKDFDGALKAYAAAAIIDIDDPTPHLHAAESYLALRKPEEALKAIEMAEERASRAKGDNTPILERLAVMKKIWNETVEEKV